MQDKADNMIMEQNAYLAHLHIDGSSVPVHQSFKVFEENCQNKQANKQKNPEIVKTCEKHFQLFKFRNYAKILTVSPITLQWAEPSLVL